MPAVARGAEDTALSRPGFDVERPEGGLSAALDLVGLRSYLSRFLSSADGRAEDRLIRGQVRRDRTPSTASRAASRLPGDGIRRGRRRLLRRPPALLPGRRGDLRTLPGARAPRGSRASSPPRTRRIVAQVKTPPRVLLHALYDSLSKADQQAHRGERARRRGASAARPGRRVTTNVGEFLDELAAQLGTEHGGRRRAPLQRLRPGDATRSGTRATSPRPTATVAAMFRILPGSKQADVDEFLADRVGRHGLRQARARDLPGGDHLQPAPASSTSRADYALVEPAFKVHDGYLILSTREDYLLEILKVMTGGPDAPASVAASPAFRATFRRPAPRGHAGDLRGRREPARPGVGLPQRLGPPRARRRGVRLRLPRPPHGGGARARARAGTSKR